MRTKLIKKGFKHIKSVMTTKYKQLRIFQRIFSWNYSRCEKKCSFREERSDFILSQISEFLSDFAHFEVWCTLMLAFSKVSGKMRFQAIWRSNMLHSPKMGQTFSWPKMASEGNLMPKMTKISIFSLFSKVSIFGFIILQNGQNPTETRSCGLFWNLSDNSDFSDFPEIKKIWAICAEN